MDIAELQTAVDAWIKTHGVRYFNELTNMTILVEEVGELARVMARKYGEQSYKEGELRARFRRCRRARATTWDAAGRQMLFQTS